MTFATAAQVRLTDERCRLFTQRDQAERCGDLAAIARIDRQLTRLEREIKALNG